MKAIRRRGPIIGTPTKSRYSTTSNIFVKTKNEKPYVDPIEIEKFLLKYPSPRIKVEGGKRMSGVKRFIKDKSKGMDFVLGKVKMDEKTGIIPESNIETYILNAVSIYLYNEPGKFPPEIKQKSDNISKNFEDPDDMPPIDKGLSELNLTEKDFKI